MITQREYTCPRTHACHAAGPALRHVDAAVQQHHAHHLRLTHTLIHKQLTLATLLGGRCATLMRPSSSTMRSSTCSASSLSVMLSDSCAADRSSAAISRSIAPICRAGGVTGNVGKDV